MARIGINTGSAANDNTGSTLRAAGGIINDNFSEIYTRFGDGTNLTSIGGTWTSTSVGIHTLKNVGIGTTNPTSALTVTGNGTFTGVVTATTFVGALTGTASTATLATNAQGLTGTPNITVGVVTASRLNVGTSGTVITTTASGLVGIGTTNPRFALEVGAVGASGTTLFVNGDARVTGIVTIGPASITLNGITNIINVGTGITINGSTGIISATSIVLGGTTLTGAAVTSITAGSGISVNQSTGNVTITSTGGGGSSQWVTTAAGIHTLSNVGIGTTNPTSALTVSGNVSISGVSTFNNKSIYRGSGSHIELGYQGGLETNQIRIWGGNASDDYLQLYADANEAYIRNTGTNAAGINISAAGSVAIGGGGTGSWSILANPDGSVSLALSIIEKLRTIGAGITVTGTTFTNQLNVSGISTTLSLNVGTGGTVITTTTAGLVGIGTTNPTEKLTVSGNAVITGITTHLDKISIRTSLGSNEYASLSNAGKLVLGDGTSTTAGIDIVNNTSSSSAEIFTISTPNVNAYSKKIIVDYGGRLLLGGNLTSSINNALTILDNSGNITLSGYVSAGGTIGASGLTAGTVQISSGIVTATSGIVTYYGDTSYTASGRWTLGASGTNDYTFTGIGFTQTTNDPVLYLARGRVYEFVNNSVGNHPFEIRVSNGGSAYSNGVTNNAAASGVIRFEVPFNAPNTLYYQCTNHSGMGATIFVTPRNEPAVGVRTTVTATTSSIGAGATSNLNIDGFKTYSLLKVGISSAAWVVLYTDSTSRSNDASRSYLTDPTPGSGVIAEVRTVSSGISTFIMSPGVIGWNNDVSVASTIYARVTNNESSTSTGIGVTLTVVKLED